MILTKQRITQEAGIYWTQSNRTTGDCVALCVTSTGRIIAGGGTIEGSVSNDDGIWYSDDNGVNWIRSNKTTGYWNALCVTPSGRIFASGEDGIWYSDDNGVNWTESAYSFIYATFCATSTGRIIAGADNIMYSDDNINWSSASIGNFSGWVSSFCVTSTGRILAACGEDGLWYSDDNGVNWAQVQTNLSSNTHWSNVFNTHTSRIFACCSPSSGVGGIWYSDNNGVNWTQTSQTTGEVTSICVTSTGKYVASVAYNATNTLLILDGVSIIQSATVTDEYYSLCVTPTGRIVAGTPGNGIKYSDPITESVTEGSKYLDQNGAQEIITQFQAYCDSLVGGA